MNSNAIKCFLHGTGHLSTINLRIYDRGEKNFISHMTGLPFDRICSHIGSKHKVCDKLGINVACCWWQPVCLAAVRTTQAIFVSSLPFMQNSSESNDVTAFIFRSHYLLRLAINQLNAHNSCFIISLLYFSTCFEHYVLIIMRSKLYYTASGVITPAGGRPVHGTATYRVSWFRVLYNTILNSRWSAHSARNM